MNRILWITAISAALSACGSSSKGDNTDPTGRVVVPGNMAPVSNNVSLQHPTPDSIKFTDQITLAYQYTDTESDAEGNSEIQWFIDDEQIENASGKTLNMNNAYYGKTLKASITPVAASGTTHGQTQSATLSIHPDAAPEVHNIQLIDTNGGLLEVGDKLTVDYTLSDREGHEPEAFTITWYSGNDIAQGGNLNEYTVKNGDLKKLISVKMTVQANKKWSNTFQSDTPLQVVPSLTFTKPDDAISLIGQTYTNPAVSDLNITYTSLSTDIAEVDSAGVVTLKQPGTAIIEATDGFSTISYTIRAISPIININARLGENDGTLLLSGDLNGMRLYASDSQDCNPEQAENCVNLQTTELENNSATTAVINDSHISLDASRYLNFALGAFKASAELNHVKPQLDQPLAAIALFKGRLWIWGGRVNDQAVNRIWSSADGNVWHEHTQESQQLFTPRSGHGVIEYNGKLYLMGGSLGYNPNTGYYYYEDVWSSADGINWEQIATSTAMGQIPDPSLTVANGRMWLIEGVIDHRYYSTDGINWIEDGIGTYLSRTKLASYTNDQNQDILVKSERNVLYRPSTTSSLWEEIDRFESQNASPFIVKANERLYFFDLYSQTGIRMDHDGSTEFFTHDLPSGTNLAQGVYNGSFYALVGMSQTMNPAVNQFQTSLYKSDDGKHWQRVNSPEFETRRFAASTWHQGELVVIGGRGLRGQLNDVWTSADGHQWQQRLPDDPTKAITSYWNPSKDSPSSLVSFNDTLYFKSNRGLFVKEDGNWNWQLQGLPALLQNDKLVATADHLWYIGNNADGNDYMLEIFRLDANGRWSYVDQIIAPPDLRQGFAIGANDEALFIAGGILGEQGTNLPYVWTSADGIRWSRLADMPAPRTDATILAQGNKVMIIGGRNSEHNTYFNDVLELNGDSWTAHTAPFSTRYGAYAIATDDTVYIGGGNSPYTLADDIWSSNDLTQWYRLINTQAELRPESPQ